MFIIHWSVTFSTPTGDNGVKKIDGGFRYISHVEVAYYQSMRESLTLFTYSKSMRRHKKVYFVLRMITFDWRKFSLQIKASSCVFYFDVNKLFLSSLLSKNGDLF